MGPVRRGSGAVAMGESSTGTPPRHRANMAHIRQYGLSFPVELLKTCYGAPSSLGSGLHLAAGSSGGCSDAHGAHGAWGVRFRVGTSLYWSVGHGARAERFRGGRHGEVLDRLLLLLYYSQA